MKTSNTLKRFISLLLSFSMVMTLSSSAGLTTVLAAEETPVSNEEMVVVAEETPASDEETVVVAEETPASDEGTVATADEIVLASEEGDDDSQTNSDSSVCSVQLKARS